MKPSRHGCSCLLTALLIALSCGCESAQISLLDAGPRGADAAARDGEVDGSAQPGDAANGDMDADSDASMHDGGDAMPADASSDGCGATCCPSQESLEADALTKACMRLIDNSCGNDASDPHERCYKSLRLPVESVGGIAPIDGLLLGGSVAVGDLDMDGRQDIVLVQPGRKASVTAHAIVAYYGKSAGTFEAPILVGAVGEDAGTVQVLDLDYDGKLDVALTAALSGNSGGLVVYYGDGARGFVRKEFELPMHPPKAFHVVNVAGDLGQDVLLDGGLRLVRDAARGYMAYDRMSLAGLQIGSIVSTSDLDADNSADFLGQLAPKGGGVVGLYFVSNVLAASSAPLLIEDGVGAWTAAVDLAGDAKSEIVGFKPSGGAGRVPSLELLVWQHDGEGAYDAPPVTSALTPVSKTRGAVPASILVSDLDDDGRRDVVYVSSTEFSRHYPEVECDAPPSWRTVNILWGDGAGHVTEPACQFAVQQPPLDLQLANINQDGTEDLVVLTRDAVEILVSIPR